LIFLRGTSMADVAVHWPSPLTTIVPTITA
jgi:hypothetical protein